MGYDINFKALGIRRASNPFASTAPDLRDGSRPGVGGPSEPIGDPVTVTVTGEGFGPAPNVVLWRTFDAETAGEPAGLSPSGDDIGTFSQSSMPVVEFKGRKYLEAFNAETGSKRGSTFFLPGKDFSHFRSHCALATPDGFFFPGTSEPESFGGSSWKPLWYMLGNSGDSVSENPDLCLPSHRGSGTFSAEGNSVKFNSFFFKQSGNTFGWNEHNMFGFAQSPNRDNPTTGDGDAWLIWTFPGRSSARIDTRSMPLFSSSGGNPVPLENAHYDRLKINPWGNSGTGVQSYIGDIYLAIESEPGANDYWQCVYLSDSENFETSGDLRPVIADTWSDSEVIITQRWNMPYYHIIKPDNSVVSGSFGGE